jgi:hypothetical protein
MASSSISAAKIAHDVLVGDLRKLLQTLLALKLFLSFAPSSWGDIVTHISKPLINRSQGIGVFGGGRFASKNLFTKLNPSGSSRGAKVDLVSLKASCRGIEDDPVTF